MNNTEVTEKIIKSCYDVHNDLGVGFIEKVYENSLVIALKDQGLSTKQQEPLKVYFRSHVVGDYFADIVVDDSVIVELKAVKSILPEHQAQLLNYLKATKFQIGLLINFAKPGLEIKRMDNKFNI